MARRELIRRALAREGRDELRIPSPASALDSARPGEASSAPSNIVVNDPALDDPLQGDAQSEPGVAAWGNYVLAAWNDGRGQHDPGFIGYIGYAYSTDGGQTFIQGGVPPNTPGGGTWTSDPVVTVNENTGDFYFCGLYDPFSSTEELHGVAVARANFFGTNLVWSTPRVVRALPGGITSVDIDKPWIAADSLSGNVYLTYTRYYGAFDDSILFSRSTDRGVTWSPSAPLSSGLASGLVQGSRPAVGPGGEVYAVWKEIGLTTSGQDYMRIRKSTDFGLTFGPERTAATFFDNFGSGAPGFNRPEGIALPSITVDRTAGARRGQIYVAWNESVNFYDSIPDTLPVLIETEPNGDTATAQPFTPGETLVGSFGNLDDFDYYRFDAVQGTSYVFWTDRIGARYTMRVLCTDGVTRLAYSGDPFNFPPRQGFFVWTCPMSGRYFFRMVTLGYETGAYRVRTGVDTPGGPFQRARDHRDVFVASSADGITWTSPTLVHPEEPPGFDDWLPEVAVAATGTVYVLWYDFAGSPPGSCGGQSLACMARSDDGGTTWSPLGAVSSQFSDWTRSRWNIIPNQGDYVSLSASADAIYPCWTDTRLGTPDIWMAPFPIDVATPALVTRFAAEAVDDGLQVRWELERPEAFATLALERADDEAGPWQAVAANAERDGATTVVVDRSVENGRTYWYRLAGVTNAGVAATYGPVRAETILAAMTFALTHVAPNPTAGSFVADFTVARPARVRLALYDVQGRETGVLVEGVRVAGRYQARWDAAGSRTPPPAGVYFLRYDAGGQTITRRVAIAR